jgi:hypothetical protein
VVVRVPLTVTVTAASGVVVVVGVVVVEFPANGIIHIILLSAFTWGNKIGRQKGFVQQFVRKKHIIKRIMIRLTVFPKGRGFIHALGFVHAFGFIHALGFIHAFGFPHAFGEFVMRN